MPLSRASFSRCKRYRYSLTRQWDDSKKLACLIGLNPSTADKDSNDPTIRRCISFTQQWGFGGFVIVNLFGFKSPHPEILKNTSDPVGSRNNIAISRTVDNTSKVILMWGNHGSFCDRDLKVFQLLAGRPLYCAGLTKTGAPRHLLYVKGGTPLERFNVKHGCQQSTENGITRIDNSDCLADEVFEKIKQEIKTLKRHGLTIYFIARDRQTQWMLRLFAAAVAAYAFSPIDLIPDFIPVLGLLDDILLVAAAYLIILKLTPLSVRLAAEQKADQFLERPVSFLGALVVLITWLVLLVLVLRYFGVVS